MSLLNQGNDTEPSTGMRTRKLRASCLALAIVSGLPSIASAADYLVSNETELLAAIAAANTDPDASATIRLANGITLTNNLLPVPVKPITIDTQGFVLQIGSGDTTGSLVGNVLNNGELVFNRSDAANFAGVVSGTGSLTQAGSGSLVLTGENSYTGGTVIDIGRLQLGNGGTGGSLVGNVLNNGVLAFNRSDTVMFGGIVSGVGALTQTGSGTTVLTGANTYTGGTVINAGTLQLGNGGSSGSLVGDVFNSGALAFNRSDVFRFDGTIYGAGSLAQNGTGTTVLSGTHGYTGATSVNAGTLQLDGFISSAVAVAASGTLSGVGKIFGNVINAGTIAPGNGLGRLTIAGDYTGNNGLLEIEAVLAGDASATDQLVIAGNTSGTTNVRVTNLGGTGAQTVEGIKAIDVQGTSDGTFNLLGDYIFQGEQAVVAGAYAYRLYKNGVSTPTDGDWYLRSAFIEPEVPAPLYAPTMPVYEAYTGVLQSMNELGTLYQRVDGATAAGADSDGSHAVWAHVTGQQTDLAPEKSTTATEFDITTWKLQAGLDALLLEGSNGALVGGLTVHFGNASSDVSSVFGRGTLEANSYGLGGTLTWYGNTGAYIDAQVQLSWYDTDLKSHTLGTDLVEGNDGFGYAFGIESGRKFAHGETWSLTQQAQLSYSFVRFKAFEDQYGAYVARDDGDSLVGRVGLSADYEEERMDRDGKARSSHVYGIANLYYDFLDGSQIDVSDTRVVNEAQAFWGGLGVGGALTWDDERFVLYGELMAKTSLEDFGDSKSYGGTVGFKAHW